MAERGREGGRGGWARDRGTDGEDRERESDVGGEEQEEEARRLLQASCLLPGAALAQIYCK